MNDDKEGTEDQDSEFIDALKRYGNRVALCEKLDQIHASMPGENVVPMYPSRWKRYVTIGAIAASVSALVVVATLWVDRMGAAHAPGSYVTLRREDAPVISQKSTSSANQEPANNVNAVNRPAHYTGTGFLLSAQGFAVTSYHVVNEADSIYLENEKFGSLKARIVYSDAANDVSIVQIISDSWRPYRVPYVLSTREASLGEKVYTLGYPREDIVFGEGAVSASSGYKRDHNAYQVSIPVNPGNSGGPLLNERGELIGIISGFQTRAQGTAFATKSKAIIDATKAPELDTLKKPIILPQRNSLQAATRVQQIQRLKEFVFMVKVYKN